MKQDDERKSAQIFNKEFKGAKNFMTPSILERGIINNYFAYELSSGEGFNHNPIFGLTIVFYNPKTDLTQRTFGMSDCYNSLFSVEKEVERLKTLKPFSLVLSHAREMKRLGGKLN